MDEKIINLIILLNFYIKYNFNHFFLLFRLIFIPLTPIVNWKNELN